MFIPDSVALTIMFEQPSYTVTEGVDPNVLICIQLLGQLDPTSVVETMVDIVPNTATCEFTNTYTPELVTM